jgi:hypothetical protein
LTGVTVGRAYEDGPERLSRVDCETSQGRLTGETAIRVCDLLQQIAAEHGLEIVSGKVARDHGGTGDSFGLLAA